MQNRVLGNSKLEVSPIGLGCMGNKTATKNLNKPV